MSLFARSTVLKEKLGSDALLELDGVLDAAGEKWRCDVLESAADRFERRLTNELSTFRVEVTKELSTVRLEIAASRFHTIRWVVGLLMAQAVVIIGAFYGMMTFLLSHLKG